MGDRVKEAIKKAVKGGWDMAGMDDCTVSDQGFVVFRKDSTPFSPLHIYQIIFDHDFAKALWPPYMPHSTMGTKFKGVETFDTTVTMNLPITWERHLQNMVIADDPIKYLGENI